MASNLLDRVQARKIFRIDVNFEIPDKYNFCNTAIFKLSLFLFRTVDNMIGRKAHI
jgi:hypothetical protein